MQQQGQRAPKALLPLLRDLGNLKRVRSAGCSGSIAERLFARAWGRLAAGEDEAEVARGTTLDGLIALRLGDLDAMRLEQVGVPAAEVRRIRQRAGEIACGELEPPLRSWLLEAVPHAVSNAAPPFVGRLAAQPRAGATCPGKGRLMLEPPESHADHCAMVAIGGVLLAAAWDARPETVFLAALAHHLHNAELPDAGFTGEEMLGAWLQPAMQRATQIALDELPIAVRRRVEEARLILPDAETPEGRAFHAADTLDRVLQVEHHLRAGSPTRGVGLNAMELVHAGPVKPFQDAMLSQMGVAA